jgi:hypothetical protein
MAEGGKTVRILFLNGQSRTFTNVETDTTTEGWLHITRLEVREAPISGVAQPIAVYRLDALVGWEYEEPN